MSNCQQCGKPNPPSKGKRARKFCSKKCGKLNHYNRYQAEGRYYTKKNPDWGKKGREEKEDRENRRKEYEWCQEHMYDIRRIEKEYGMDKHTAWYRAKTHGLEPRIVRWKQEYHFYTKEQVEQIVNDVPPPPV